jgi:hypothetical protein
MVYEMAAKQKRDAVTNSPAYFHNALMYSKIGYQFGNPQLEGAFQVLLNDLEDDLIQKGLARVSLAFLCGRVRLRATNQRILWVPGEQFVPISDRFKAYFSSNDYVTQFKKIIRSRKSSSALSSLLHLQQSKGGGGQVFYIDWESEDASPEELHLSLPFRRVFHVFLQREREKEKEKEKDLDD